MKTIRFKEINGVKIVTGLDSPPMDPVATMKKIQSELEKTSEWKEFVTLSTAKDKVKGAHIKDEADKARQKKEISALMQKMDPLKRDLRLKARRMFSKNIQLSGLRANEIEITDADATKCAQLISTRQPNELVTTGLELVKNNVGASYWLKTGNNWDFHTVIKLKEEIPTDAVLDSELTDEQKKEISVQLRNDHIAQLTTNEKKEKKASELESAARGIALDVVAAEVKGKSKADAMKEAKEKFAAAEAEIAERFK